MSVKSSVSSLIFCLVSVSERGVLKSRIVGWSISPFSSVGFMKFEGLLLDTYTFKIVKSS